MNVRNKYGVKEKVVSHHLSTWYPTGYNVIYCILCITELRQHTVTPYLRRLSMTQLISIVSPSITMISSSADDVSDGVTASDKHTQTNTRRFNISNSDSSVWYDMADRMVLRRTVTVTVLRPTIRNLLFTDHTVDETQHTDIYTR